MRPSSHVLFWKWTSVTVYDEHAPTLVVVDILDSVPTSPEAPCAVYQRLEHDRFAIKQVAQSQIKQATLAFVSRRGAPLVDDFFSTFYFTKTTEMF